MKKLLPYLKNKYIIAILAFVLWLLFFDQNNWINQIKYKMDLKKLEKDKAFYKEGIKKAEKEFKEIKTNPKTLEKFAREQYLMKKSNEEVFVIVEEGENE
jgi:cell division protein FtsB